MVGKSAARSLNILSMRENKRSQTALWLTLGWEEGHKKCHSDGWRGDKVWSDGPTSFQGLVCVLRHFPPKGWACKSQAGLVTINMGLVWSMTAALSSNVSTPCAGTLCRGWRTFWREHGSVLPYFPAHPLGHGLWPLPFPGSIYHFLQPPSIITTGGLLLLLPGGKQSDITQRFWGDTEKHQCTFAYGLKTSTVVNRNHSLQPGQSTGILGRQVVRTKMLVWELATLSSFSHPPVLFFPSSNPLTFPFLSYIIFSKMWNSRKDFRRGQVILFFSLLSFKVYCIITYIITKANITIFKTSLIYSPCF